MWGWGAHFLKSAVVGSTASAALVENNNARNQSRGEGVVCAVATAGNGTVAMDTQKMELLADIHR
jgi:hypothetical protein